MSTFHSVCMCVCRCVGINAHTKRRMSAKSYEMYVIPEVVCMRALHDHEMSLNYCSCSCFDIFRCTVELSVHHTRYTHTSTRYVRTVESLTLNGSSEFLVEIWVVEQMSIYWLFKFFWKFYPNSLSKSQIQWFSRFRMDFMHFHILKLYFRCFCGFHFLCISFYWMNHILLILIAVDRIMACILTFGVSQSLDWKIAHS